MNIEFDPKIRDWVFLPMIYVTVTVGIIKMLYGHYSRYTTAKEVMTTTHKYHETSDKKLFARCDKLAKIGNMLTEESFNSRRTFLAKPEGHLNEKSKREKPDATKAMMDTQKSMFSSMKGTLGMGATMMLQMGWVNYFFSGFILAKVPFPLTQKFRGMMQNGVDMENLDVTYVSGLSFYFLLMFGMSELQNILIDQEQFKPSDEEMDQQMQQQAQQPASPMGGPMGGGGAGMMGANPMMAMMGMPGASADNKKQFETQIQNLTMVYHKFILKDGEDMALARLEGRIV